MRRPGPLFALALFALGCHETREPRPNVLLISLDSVRADFVGAYGAKLPYASGRSPTPNLDRLAAAGVLYEDAFSTTSWTLPAHVSLLTGEPELVHGVEQDGQCIPTELRTLAEVLRADGYRTYGVYSGPYLDPRHGFARGFERYEAGYGAELARATDEVALASKLVDSFAVEREPERARVAVERRTAAELALETASQRDVSSERVTDLVLAELERAARDERPFFVFAHYFDPHYDYAPPEPFASAFDPDYAGTLDAHAYFTNPAVAAFDAANPSGRRQVASARDLEHIRALYAGEIAWTDAQLGRLFDELERRGLADQTLVVVVGDHGDEFFEHGSIGHRQTLFEETLRVPLILRRAGRTPAGERRKEPLALCELKLELLELLSSSDLHQRLPQMPVARLVRPEFATHEFQLDGQPQRAAGLRIRVLESFRYGPLKLHRERSFLRATEPLEPAQLRALEQASLREFEREDLRWIDLTAHPGEPEDAWSPDFSDSRAREALLVFRSSYATLTGRRASPPVVAESAELLSALRGLGYVGQEARLGTLASDALVLPPPGASSPGTDGH